MTSYYRSYQPMVLPSTFRPGGFSKRRNMARKWRRGSSLKRHCVEQDFRFLGHQCLADGALFEDPEFPADATSVYYRNTARGNYTWKRPHEIVGNPKFFVEGASRFDVQQGDLGNCWLAAAVANLTLYPKLFNQCVPPDQSFTENYAGIFHFRFWQYGEWVDVVVDDRLPTNYGKLVFSRSTQENEFWTALLEKAYAKLLGSYEILMAGSTSEAMEDLTGGVTEMFNLKKSKADMFDILLKSYQKSSLMGCSLEPDSKVFEAETSLGLIRGHAYSITKVTRAHLRYSATKVQLIRIRNPWGNQVEWRGPWSDKSCEWQQIPEYERHSMGLTFDSDGEFWMSYEDFRMHFDRLEICSLSPDTLEPEITSSGNVTFEMTMFDGTWTRGISAGGCRNQRATFWQNPQYRITLQDADDEDDEKCTLIIALMQKHMRAHRKFGQDYHAIGFEIYMLQKPQSLLKPLPRSFFELNIAVASSPSYINLREVTGRYRLQPGTYCIIPSTFTANQEAEFLLRVFTEKKNEMEENDEKLEVVEEEEEEKEPPAPEMRFKTKAYIKLDPKPQDTELAKLCELFERVAGADQEVDWQELKQVLDFALQKVWKFKVDPLSKDVCRSMIAMMDADFSGMLGFEEFRKLFDDIIKWKCIFLEYDHDHSGTLDTCELREALNAAGYRLNYRILSILAKRYGNKDGKMSFDDFMMCAIKLKTMIKTFDANTLGKQRTAWFTLEEWVQATLYS